MKAMKKVGAERLTYEELDKVTGGVAWVDDFINWVSEEAGKFIKKLFK